MPKQATLPAECDLAEIALGANVRDIETSSDAFKELVASIKTHGVLEPLLVRPLKEQANGHVYDLVAGYRRYAAAKVAGVKVVPVRVLELNDTERSEVQLLENLLRKDLTPMEEARGIHAYAEAAKASPKDIATRIHKSQAYVKSRLALNALIPELVPFLEEGHLTVTQAAVIATYAAEVQKAILDDEGEDIRWGGFRDANAQDAERTMDIVKRELEEVAAFKKKIEESKYPKCPKCGGDVVGQTYDKLAECQNHHEWSLASGKGRSVRENIGSYAPKRQTIDRAETRTLRGISTPQEILNEWLAGVKVDYIKVEAIGGGATVEYHLSEKNVPEALRTKENVTFALVPVDYSSGEHAQIVVDGYDGPARKKAKAVVRNFLADTDSGKASKTPSDLTEAIQKLLAGERADVVKRLAKFKVVDDESRELLERARDAEAEGEARASVMIEMDALLDTAHLD
ncbi:MAG TPA: ParB/RepB/Spo0J family partition protein [Thermoplasmata archaeon]|nr:ParB/RepB/Spo0J family partition protein [Thermoplasmata archaeon]